MSAFQRSMRVYLHRAGEQGRQKVLELVVVDAVEDLLVLDGAGFDPGDLELFLRGALFSGSAPRPDAMLAFEGRVADAALLPTGPRVQLRLAEEPRRIQRRKWYRVERGLDFVIQLPLENRPLGKSLGRSWLEAWWLRARLHNLSAGGLRLNVLLPEGHHLVRHREARVRLRLEDNEDCLELKDRRLVFRRLEGEADKGQLAYGFADLDKDEQSRLHKLNVRHEQRRLKEEQRRAE